jgi:hypothetical protein
MKIPAGFSNRGKVFFKGNLPTGLGNLVNINDVVLPDQQFLD